MTINWVDVTIILVTAFYIVDGWRRGFTVLVVNLISFLAALWLAIRYHAVLGSFFIQKFGIPQSWTNVLGYIFIAFAAQLLIDEIGLFLVARLPERIAKSRTNHSLGAVVSICTGLITVTFFILLIAALPLRGTVKRDIEASTLAQKLVFLSERYGGQMKSSLDDIARQAKKFLTVEPGSNERLTLDLPNTNGTYTIDTAAASYMTTLVNNERVLAGIGPLIYDERIAVVAQEKSRDMFENKYFSHTDLEGKNAGDRFEKAGIAYMLVGENLAYAPDTDTAHSGLMDSPGHRANILEPKFHRIGIGVIDGGIHGKMFTQMFAD